MCGQLGRQGGGPLLPLAPVSPGVVAGKFEGRLVAMRADGRQPPVEVDASKAVDCILRPGEMSLHHVKLVHGSEPNRSNDRRIGLAIRYIPTYVRQVKVRDSATLVRGVDEHHNFDLEPRPKLDLDEAAMAAHADAVGRQVKALYSGTDKQTFRA